MPYGRKSAKSTKSTKSVVLATASRSARVAKGKDRTIIRTAIVSKSRISHASEIIHIDPDRNLSSISRSCSTESALGGESSDVDESSNDRGTLMGDIQKMI